jgi:uncharacterized cysteine cluster protein YcgN (CxxCxxCC family)
MEKRTCGSCTKCCEGHLTGEALGHKFYQGRPCHFVSVGKGCSVYSKRPKDPCITYKCGWLTNLDIPEWLKPEATNVIIDFRNVDGHSFVNLIEAGSVVSSKILNWFIQYALNNKLNAAWSVEGGKNYIGTEAFIKAIDQDKSK